MYDLIQLGNNVSDVKVSPEFDVYSKVIIHIDNDTQVVAGNDTGLTLEFDNPFGDQAMADRILASLQGFRYSPYTANGALLDPAAEIGDAVQTTTSFGGLYSRYRTFDALMPAEIAAPCDEEIDHEFTFETPDERKFKRTVGEVKASLLLTNNMIQAEVTNRENADNYFSSQLTQTANAITAEVARATSEENTLRSSLTLQADQISAKVSESGGGASFSWALNSTSHIWKSGNTEVMKISATGLVVKGEVQATSGLIGGFTIGASAIYNNISEFGGTQSSGVYVGTNGIQLGQNFKADTGGNVTASNLKLNGTIQFLNADGTSAGTMTAANLRTGAQQAYSNHGAWTSGVSSWNGAQNSSTPIGSFYGNTIGAFYQLSVYQNAIFRCYGRFFKNNTELTLKTKTIDGETINYLGW